MCGVVSLSKAHLFFSISHSVIHLETSVFRGKNSPGVGHTEGFSFNWIHKYMSASCWPDSFNPSDLFFVVSRTVWPRDTGVGRYEIFLTPPTHLQATWDINFPVSTLNLLKKWKEKPSLDS